MSTENGRTLGGTEDASGATGGGGKLLSETRFYSSYSQHIDFGGRETGMAEQNAQSILQHGFRQSTNVNLLPPSSRDSVHAEVGHSLFGPQLRRREGSEWLENPCRLEAEAVGNHPGKDGQPSDVRGIQEGLAQVSCEGMMMLMVRSIFG
jgi:hypothetical protein